MPILLQGIRDVPAHMVFLRRSQNETNIAYVSLHLLLAPDFGHNQSACRMLTYLRYSHLANLEYSTLGFC